MPPHETITSTARSSAELERLADDTSSGDYEEDNPSLRESANVQSKATWLSGMITVIVCAVYMVVGPLLIMSNKYLLTSERFEYPIMLTALHQIASALATSVLIRCCRVVPLKQGVSWKLWRTNILAVATFNTAALCTGTASYLYLTVAFIEILKGFTPVVTMMVQSLFGEPPPSCRIAAAVLMISFGAAVSSFGEMHLNLTGLVLMLSSVYCEATRLMLTQRLLSHMDFHVLELLYYLSPCSALVSVATALALEWPHFRMRRFLLSWDHAWHLFVANALLGFLVNVVSFLVIKRTNVVMLKLLAISRNTLVVLSGITLFGDVVTRTQFVGYSISLICFGIYNVFLIQEQTNSKR
jgi:hypothetical protein